jgi:hypothetical protein
LAGADRTLSGPNLRTVMAELDEEETGQLEAVLAEHGLHSHERFRREKKPWPKGSETPRPPVHGLFTRDGATEPRAARGT